jgi:hypothetical protein
LELTVTIPFERTRAIVETKLFLLELMDPRVTPRVPHALRGKAKSLLKHFPTYADIEQAHKALPDTYGPVPPFSRLCGGTQTAMTIEITTENGN